MERLDSEGVVAVDGAPTFLRSLPPRAVGLVTSASLEMVTARMPHVGIPIPRVVVTGDDILRGKPAPDCYLLGASRLGVDPADTVVFEDAEAGIVAGLAAGMSVVVVGPWESPTTTGLLRILTYSKCTAEIQPDHFVLNVER
jgi:sugar-phosphatase